ncbi:Glycosyltransferase involved in cell wall bisynthesis [Lachnospiraceae bacterium RM5]|nr:Glycosyltransferase involved in cell wall bisynthesis [Lachnospiraceae bacterium RM5]
MDIVIVANFCMDFSKSDNGRFSYLANMLAEDGNDVEIITSDFYHITKKPRDYYPKELAYKVTFIHEPGYSRNVCLKRFFSHKTWANNLRDYLSKRKKPDVVYCAVPSLDGPLYVAKYCETNKIRFVVDIQDLWPEAFQMVFNVPVLSKFIFWPLKKKANVIYERADAICAVSDTYCKRAAKVNKKVKDTTTVFLGTELVTFDRYAKENPILEKKEGEIWLAYCGTLGSSYDLTCVIEALAILKDENIRFIIMGDGPMMDEFKKHAETKNVKTKFVGRLKYDAMCSLLKACDITVNPIAHMAAQSIINKHADYVASGLPVVSTQENEEFRRLISEYQMGFNCRNNDSSDLAAKIKTLVNDEELRNRMGNNARRCAEERFDRESTYRLLEQEVLKKTGGVQWTS